MGRVGDAILLTGAEIHFHTVYAQIASSSFERADQFDARVNEALAQLGRCPQSAPAYLDRFRRPLRPDSTYALYCVAEGDRVFVHALLDVRQSPEAIRRHPGLLPE
ncbi:MAG: hypothetical protein JWQ44_825 [Chthoniobacter sp.]|nr:hypothetical protein [Chthoniobacter sp.]